MAKLTDKFYNRVIEGKLVADSGDELPNELPSVTGSDNGKVLVVSGGKWDKGTISGGTKLYKHTISVGANETLTFISTSASKITSNAGLAGIFEAGNYYGATYMNASNATMATVISFKYNEGFDQVADLVAIKFYEAAPSTDLVLIDISSWSLSSNSDNVTPIQ